MAQDRAVDAPGRDVPGGFFQCRKHHPLQRNHQAGSRHRQPIKDRFPAKRHLQQRAHKLPDAQRDHERHAQPRQPLGQQRTAETVANQHPRHHRHTARAEPLHQPQAKKGFEVVGGRNRRTR